MIDFRYHLVSIIAIFFALAAGIVLGAGPLGATVDDDLPGQLSAMREENRSLRDQIEVAEAEQAFQEVFLTDVTPRLVADQLQGQHVAVVALPGAEDDAVVAMRDALSQTGATADLTVRVEPSWTDANSEPVLDDLASQLVSSGTELPEDADGYERGATVLAAALLGQTGEGTEGSASEQTVDTAAVTAFAEAGLISLEQDAAVAPTLVVAVAGPVSGEDAEERVGRLVTLTKALDAEGGGAVVTGPAAAAEDGGVLAAIRADGDVAESASTVDSGDVPSGRVAVIFALTEQEQGGSGHYGIVGDTDGALPPVPEPETPGDGESPGGSTGEPTGDAG